MRFRQYSFSSPPIKRLIDILAIFVAITLMVIKSEAQCLKKHETGIIYEMSNKDGLNYSIFIDGEQVVMEVSETERSRVSVKQKNFPAPEDLIWLSSTEFAVLGLAKSYLISIEKENGALHLSRPDALPVRYVQRCSYWGKIAGSCIIAPAQYSPALSSVVISGWDNKNRYGSMVYRSGEQPKPLISPDGAPLGYLWDDEDGNAVLRTQSGDGYTATRDQIAPCGQYPPLSD